jgi:hypothetical protein
MESRAEPVLRLKAPAQALGARKGTLTVGREQQCVAGEASRRDQLQCKLEKWELYLELSRRRGGNGDLQAALICGCNCFL